MDEISETQDALRQTIANEKKRLVNAHQQREFLRKQLEAGIVPDHYRIEWLQHTSMALIETLAGMAAGFNRQYPMDKITNLDFIDALNTARAKIATQSYSMAEE